MGPRVQAGRHRQLRRAVGAATSEQDHQRAGEVPRDEDVHERRESEEEGEAAHVTHGDEVQQDCGQEADGVRGQDRAPRRAEASVHRGPYRAPRSRLVFQTFEIHDVTVHRDTDRHDEARYARQVETGREGGVAEGRDDRPEQRGGDCEAQDDHEAQRAVVDDRVEQHQGESDEARDEARDECAVAERRRDRLGVERHQAHRQRTELHGDRQGLGARLGEGTRDLTGPVEAREAGLGRLDDRCGLDDAVELDGDQLVEVGLGDLVPERAAGLGQRVIDDPGTQGVLLGDCLGDRLAGHLGGTEQVAHASRAQQRQDHGLVRLVQRGVRRGDLGELGVGRDVRGRTSGRVHVQVRGGQLVRRAARGQRADERVGLGGLGLLTLDRPEQELRGLANRLEDLLRVRHPRDGDHDVLALEVHGGARDTEAVHAVVENGHDFLHVSVGRRCRGLVHHREATGQVDTQLGPPSQRQGRREGRERDRDREDEADDQGST